jgi:hypothetical protein
MDSSGPPICQRQHFRCANARVAPQRPEPGELGLDLRLVVVSVPVHPQYRPFSGDGVVHGVRGVLADVEQGQRGVLGEPVLRERAPGDRLEARRHVLAREVVGAHVVFPANGGGSAVTARALPHPPAPW